MVGQHGVYCQSARTPGTPTMDIALVLEQIGDAKELRAERHRARTACMTHDRARTNRRHRALQPARAARAGRPWRPLSRARHQGAGARSRCVCCPRISPPTAAALIEQARGLTAAVASERHTLFDVGEHEGRVYIAFEFLRRDSRCASEMAGRAMNVRRAVEIAIQIADAVADAHAGGIRARRSQSGVDRDHRQGARQDSGVRAGRRRAASSTTVARPGCTTTNRPRRRAARRRTTGPTSIRSARSCTRC